MTKNLIADGNQNHVEQRYSAEEFSVFNFYQMPKFLFRGIYKEKLNSNHRIIYMMLLNHFQLSVQNGWTDKDGFIYLHFTELELSDESGISVRTVQNCMKVLAEVCLIESVSSGAMRANSIYLLKPNTDLTTTEKYNGQESDSNNSVGLNSDSYMVEQPTSGTQILPADTQKLRTDAQNFPSDTQNLPASNTDKNKNIYLKEVVITDSRNNELEESSYQALVNEYGKEAVDYQIQKIRSHGYRGCMNEHTIRKWCQEARARPVLQRSAVRKNSFNDYEQRDYNYDALEQIALREQVGYA